MPGEGLAGRQIGGLGERGGQRRDPVSFLRVRVQVGADDLADLINVAHGEQAATAIVEQIRKPDQRARSASAPTFSLLAYRQ